MRICNVSLDIVMSEFRLRTEPTAGFLRKKQSSLSSILENFFSCPKTSSPDPTPPFQASKTMNHAFPDYLTHLRASQGTDFRVCYMTRRIELKSRVAFHLVVSTRSCNTQGCRSSLCILELDFGLVSAWRPHRTSPIMLGVCAYR
jgi:hypothetical protein